jgi:hypothetical protein
MKIIATMTAEEKNKTLEGVLFDPCTYIHCGEIDCDECPLQDVARALRKAQEDYENAIDKITIEG